jgi:hypothetical protein
MKKTRGKKSHETIHLNYLSKLNLLCTIPIVFLHGTKITNIFIVHIGQLLEEEATYQFSLASNDHVAGVFTTSGAGSDWYGHCSLPPHQWGPSPLGGLCHHARGHIHLSLSRQVATIHILFLDR